MFSHSSMYVFKYGHIYHCINTAHSAVNAVSVIFCLRIQIRISVPVTQRQDADSASNKSSDSGARCGST
jgi:hypothetical protein